jgi:hypothetical protein
VHGLGLDSGVSKHSLLVFAMKFSREKELKKTAFLVRKKERPFGNRQSAIGNHQRCKGDNPATPGDLVAGTSAAASKARGAGICLLAGHQL